MIMIPQLNKLSLQVPDKAENLVRLVEVVVISSKNLKITSKTKRQTLISF
jgi:hypothetical protein